VTDAGNPDCAGQGLVVAGIPASDAACGHFVVAACP
jgi:hypothetical protein